MNQPDQSSSASAPDGSGSSWGRRQGTNLSIRTQRRTWTRRADTWDRHNDAGMTKVAAKAIEMAEVRPGMVCVDLGCGGGRLALALARLGASVIGVDVSAAMVERMQAQAKDEGIENVSGVVSPIERLNLPEASVDLVISNYALHHLLDPDKAKVVTAAYGWLKPGGVLINSDMMLGRGASSDDRKVIASKIKVMAKKGIPGYWRILKNAGRYLFRLRERPITPEAWMRLYQAAGFEALESVNVVSEANVVKGVKPAR
ncbi:MAG: class I SAM-dependent methyltransferase [Acidimicrobiaceae bacterium]|nr:class I SAM-dependent methyltransferase [Acidimicrobiaceae bacterium]